MKFIDEVKIKVISGNGGPGAVSFRRESHVPRGGPDGGDGGKGGDVVIRVNPQLSTLLDLRYKRICKAKNGSQGSSRLKSGVNGEDVIIEVPKGTIVRSIDGEFIVDLNENDQTYTIASGGRGGKGNHFFKTSINQAPQHAQPGEEGEEKDIELELKLLADVGIIGFPNVGKSTLISRMSSAKPKIANYEFTTLVPNLGVVRYGNERTFVVADIPGLIKGASEGVGLGIQFLKHVERTEFFVHVIDVSEANYRSPLEDYYDIQNELKKYDEFVKKDDLSPLSQRQQLILLNKIDSLDEESREKVKAEFEEKGLDVFMASAVTGENIKELIYAVGDRLFAKEEEFVP